MYGDCPALPRGSDFLGLDDVGGPDSSQPLAALALDQRLPVDPAVQMGRLDNGVTYWVRSHATPPGKIALWMHVATGSVNEEDGQEGLAHFLEHMAFNGTQHFPPGKLVDYFESIGLRFGQHQNAFTSFNQTTYLLELPDTASATIDQGLRCLADFAFRMLLTEEEIDQERHVLLAEKRARKGVRQRLSEQLLPQMLPGSRVARRLPIGLESTINHARRADLLAYYHKWYHPAKVTILAVGDAPVHTMVTAIRKHFASWQRADLPPQDKDDRIKPYPRPRAIVVTDPELTTATVEVLAIMPRAPMRTVADFRRRVVTDLGTWIVNRRLHQLVQEGKAPYQSARVNHAELFTVAEQFSVEATSAPETWVETLRSLLTELRRVRLYGFTAQELANAKKAKLAAAEHAVQTEPTRDAWGFLRTMNWALTNGVPPRSAAQRLRLLRQLVPAISSAEVQAAFAVHTAPDHQASFISLPEKPDLTVPATNEVLALADDVRAMPVTPWSAAARPAALLEAIPEPGRIREQSHFAPLDVTHVTFDNNVRLHYRFMDFKEDRVTVTLTLPGGKIREQEDTRGITDMASLALSRPATSRLSSTAIRDLMTGKQVWVGGHMTADALILKVIGTPEALEEGLQLVYLLLQDARIEPPAVRLWQRRNLQGLEALRRRLGARVTIAANRLLSGNDPRWAMLTPAQIKARAAAIPRAQAWLKHILRTAPIEAAIVGDISPARALQLASTYLGSLPIRPRIAPSPQALRRITGFRGPVTQTVEVDTITPRAHLLLLWRCADWQDVRGRRVMYLATRILERRLRREIREALGLTYSPRVYAQPSKIYPRMSALYVEFTTDPQRAEAAAEAARSVVETFAAEGPTPEEMATVHTQLQNALAASMRRPRFWSNLLADLEYHGTRLEDVHGLIEKLVRFDRADIAAEMRQVVVPERFAMILGYPKPQVTDQEGASSPQTPVNASQ
jgi:zinc protease